MNATKTVVISFVLLISAGFLGWYVGQPNTMPMLTEQSLAILPDALAEAVFVRQYDNQGKLSHTLRAPKLIHIPKDNTSYFIEPKAIIYRNDDNNPWVITADKARADEGNKQIVLWQEVIIKQAHTVINTEKLHYDPATQMATTDELITLVQPGVNITSMGMQADLTEENVRLLSNAQGVFNKQQIRSET